MHINSSLDWPEVEAQLRASIQHIRNPQNAFHARKMLRNFEGMITKLSQVEVTSRRAPGQNGAKAFDELAKFNEELDNFDKWILMLMLT